MTLASAPSAALQAGPAWFKAVIDEASAAYPDVAVTAILDCGDAPGAVMAALRAGLTQLRFSGAPELHDKLTAMGAVFSAAPAPDARLDLLDEEQPEAVCHRFLAPG